MGVEVKITDNSGKLKAALPPAIERALIAIGMAAESHAKQIITDAPAVVTGRLRNSITYALSGKGAANPTYSDDDGNEYSYSGSAPNDKNSVFIGTNVEYAEGIETGSHREKGAVHFLEHSARNYSDEYRKLMKDSLENA